jgi:hypothetical protein
MPALGAALLGGGEGEAAGGAPEGRNDCRARELHRAVRLGRLAREAALCACQHRTVTRHPGHPLAAPAARTMSSAGGCIRIMLFSAAVPAAATRSVSTSSGSSTACAVVYQSCKVQGGGRAVSGSRALAVGQEAGWLAARPWARGLRGPRAVQRAPRHELPSTTAASAQPHPSSPASSQQQPSCSPAAHPPRCQAAAQPRSRAAAPPGGTGPAGWWRR